MSSEGAFYKAVGWLRRDCAEQSVPGTLEKRCFTVVSEKNNELFTPNCSALFLGAAQGSCSQRALGVQESCHGCCGLEFGKLLFLLQQDLCVFPELW